MASTVSRRRAGHTGSVSVRVDKGTRETLSRLAKETRQPMQHVLADAVEQYRRQQIMRHTNLAYAALRADSGEWREEEEERDVWDCALMDGLADE
jgi:predicted transcriptional regulator